MNPFRKRSKSTSAADSKKPQRNATKGGQLSGTPQIISTIDVAFSLPSENAFRTSLLLPKMADRFSLLRLDEPGQGYKKESQQEDQANQHSGMHTRDLSILEEYDEEEEDLPVHPWDRREAHGRKEGYLSDGVSKDEFLRVRAQEGNSTLFSGKQRTFKFRTEDGNDINRQYSSSSMSSKSPHSPAFEYQPQSSHTSATSSILFSTTKPPPPQINSKAAKTLGFDFGLPEPQTLPVQPPSPTSTVYEVIDSPIVPEFLDDEHSTIDVIRDHLRRPDTSHTLAPAPNYHEAQYRPLQRKNSRAKKTETVFQVDDGDRESMFWNDNSSVFDFYGDLLDDDGVEEMERVIMGEEWVQTRHTGQQPSKTANTNTPKSQNTYPHPPKSPKFANPPKSPKYPNSPRSPNPYLNPPRSPAHPNPPKSPITRGPKNPRESLFDDLPPSRAPLNVRTNVTILKSPTVSPLRNRPVRNRDSDESMIVSSTPFKTARPIQYESGGVLGLGYESGVIDQNSNSPTERSRQGSTDQFPRSQSSHDGRNPASGPISTDPRYITPELHSTSVFPYTPPPSVSPNQSGFTSQPYVPDRSLTPPPSNTVRKAPTGNVIKALKDRIISEPQLISMTATVPTVPIIRMGDEKVEKLRNEHRKTRMNSSRKPRRNMLEDEMDDIRSSSPSIVDRQSHQPGPQSQQPGPQSQPGPFTRQRRASPPAVASRGQTRRRETTAGSVLLDEQLRDRATSPRDRSQSQQSSSRLMAEPEYTTKLPSPHHMDDNPYQPVQQSQSRQHRRKVSRQDINPVMTHSSPAILNQWDGHPKRRMEFAIDPAW